MVFEYYEPFVAKNGVALPGVKPAPMPYDKLIEIVSNPELKSTVERYRNGDANAKKALPAATWCGVSKTGKRLAADMTPTQFFMVDIDKMEEDAHEAADELMDRIKSAHLLKDVLLVHITPSGRGLRIVTRAAMDFPTTSEHMDWLSQLLRLSDFGVLDGSVKDLGRLSFLVPLEDFCYINADLYKNTELTATPIITSAVGAKPVAAGNGDEMKNVESTEDFSQYSYRGHLLQDIISRYVEVYGEPGQGERHNFYNQMVKYFRCICDNNPLVLHQLLPRFDPQASSADYLSQCRSICRTNTTGRLPKEFYVFLVKNGFYKRADSANQEADDEDSPQVPACQRSGMPDLPPVFKELVGIAPPDYSIACINALMPIMGTITSYVRAVYPYDQRTHSTSFFSVIYSPPSSGKGFVERFVSMLLKKIKMRDQLSEARERIYMNMINRKGSNDKAPENPCVTKRIVPSKVSETEFLEKQMNNEGHHMFTVAAEIDEWRKGVRAAGGNKDDLIRIAWDNGEYGQMFKSANSFKGSVPLYWNILMTGTIDQLNAYFKNVENGLVTRCCFTPIENQEFARACKWGTLSKTAMRTVDNFVTRCDEREYAEPLDYDMSQLRFVNEEDFDKEVPWRHTFRDFVTVDMSWVMPTIDRWLEKTRLEAEHDVDYAKDVFRRRVAVRGFRLALLCTQCYTTVDTQARRTICNFIKWWMDVDLYEICLLYSQKYNSAQAESKVERVKFQSLWELLPDKFTTGDVKVSSAKVGNSSPPRVIISIWKKNGLIEKTAVGEYAKVQAKETCNKTDKKKQKRKKNEKKCSVKKSA